MSISRGLNLSTQSIQTSGRIEQDDAVGAIAEGERSFGWIHTSRQYAPTAGFRELDRGGPNNPRRTGYEHCLASFETATLEQCEMCCLKAETKTDGVEEIETVRQTMTEGCWYRNLLHVAATLDERENTIADTKIGHVGSNRADDASDLLSRTKGKRCQILIDAAHHEEIGIIHAGHMDVDLHL